MRVRKKSLRLLRLLQSGKTGEKRKQHDSKATVGNIHWLTETYTVEHIFALIRVPVCWNNGVSRCGD